MLKKALNPEITKYPVIRYEIAKGEMRFDKSCRECNLGCGNATPYSGPEDISKVRLILISDYPGAYEAKYGFNQVPAVWLRESEGLKTRQAFPWPNSGEFIRSTLNELFGLCTWSEVWMTNALKCHPFRGKESINIAKGKHIRPCINRWLKAEFQTLDSLAPDAPLLICGSQALTAVAEIYKDAELATTSVNKNRGRLLEINGRPAIVTYNPAAICGLIPRVISQMGTKNGGLAPTQVKVWQRPYLVGSAPWFYERDLLKLKPYIPKERKDSN